MRGKDPYSTREALYQVAMERAEFYKCSPPEGLWAALMVQPEEVDDGTPLEAEIDVEVQGLKGGIARGASGINTEYLMGWLREAKR